MQAGGSTEMIWHFAGYLHMADVLARSETLYDGVYSNRPLEIDPSRLSPEPIQFVDLEDTASRTSPLALADTEQVTFFRSDLRPLNIASEPLLANVLPKDLSRPAISQSAINSSEVNGIAGPRMIEVSYREAETEVLVEINQINAMEDRDIISDKDVVLRDSKGSPVELQSLEGGKLFVEALNEATDATPNALPYGPGRNGVTLSVIEARDASWSDEQAPVVSGAITVADGNVRYVDGAVSDSPLAETDGTIFAPWREGEDVSTLPSGGTITAAITGPSEPSGVIVEAGLNQAINAARLVDAAEATGSMIVGGDHFFSKAIVQVNVLTDSDHISLTTGNTAALPSLITAGNEVHNVAEFVHEETTGIFRGAASTPRWQVDVVKGDFIDFKSITQTNGLDDNDTTYQSVSGTFFNLQTGLNEQVNLVNVFGLNAYDVIIIAGDYHQADWIFQYNIMIDCDQIFAAGEGSTQSSTLTTGANTLTNDALITTYGPGGFNPMNDAQHDLMDALAAGQTILVGDPEWQLTGSATGTLRVLYVSGDYYDVNVITQINMMTDLDQAVQILPDSTAPQGAVTGGNLALNEAQIIDPGTLSESQFLGGTAYEESILIQVNIVTDDDEIMINDPMALVPEVVAFVGEDEPCPHTGDETPCSAYQAHQDQIMSSGMV
jgi:hypothetical protein